eukprot:CAMPEP_0204195536 /NCGR_PEP_ID=MMETSP0361-20130328/63167_1 /ASSEMBLY_ACC=CAM_ASM_000343 /TAXON_ID=268821 /ORGANISM="Scrippsiella Hangoei, Strain SHTV-5" /LENGTH=112 /DNA_ID=CAMNT_0051157121 /DNA_START=13 /DNA_END=348 /DNA_ORIENTATION=+
MAGMTNCGGHFASNCGTCAGSNGFSWCNGDCLWIDGPFGTQGTCMDKSPLLMAPGLASGLSNSTWSLSAVALSAAVMLVYACVYKRKVVDKIGKASSLACSMSTSACRPFSA